MVEMYMKDNYEQFNDFDTGPDSDFKPIFMIGKCKLQTEKE